MRLSIVLLVALFLLSPAFAAVNISSCGAGSVITASDIYTVNASLSGAPNAASTGNACIVIGSDNVVVDCQGNTISHDDSANTEAIIVNTTASAVSNVTIKNCLIRDYNSGIVVDQPAGGYNRVFIINNTLVSNAFGIRIPSIWVNPILQGNTIANNTDSGYKLDNYFSGLINMTGDRLQGNSKDIYYPSGGSALTITISDILLGDASNTYRTNVSISHSTADATRGTIDWVPTPSSPAATLSGFMNKSFNITHTYMATFGTSNQFNITMKWAANEGSMYEWSRLQMWMINDSGAYLMNSSPDIANRELSVTGYVLNSAATSAVIALYYNNTCPVISSSGIYALPNNLAGSPNPVVMGPTYNACVVINSSNVDFDCNGYGISTGSGGNTIAIAIANVNGNVTVRNCPSVTGYDYGIRTYNANNTNITNSTFNSNNAAGITFVASNNNLVSNAVSMNNPGSAEGFQVLSSTNDTFTNCTAQGNSDFGFWFDSSNQIRVINSTVSGGLSSAGGIRSSDSPNGVIANNTVFGGTQGSGLNLTNSPYANISGNTISSFTPYGLYADLNTGNLQITNNTFRGNTAGGVYLDASSAVNLTNNTAYNNTGPGIELFYVDVFRLSGNRAYNNSGIAFYLYQSTRGQSTGDVAYNSSAGFLLTQSSSNNNLTSPTAYNNQVGISISDISVNVTLVNATAYNNTVDGLVIANYANNTTAINTHLYNNARDFRASNGVGGPNMPINLTNTIFDCPLGNYTNYTNLTILDTVNTGFQYYINWTSNRSVLPTDYFSFREKFVEITNQTAGVTIDSLIWQWTDVEIVPPYNDSRFDVMKNSSGTWASAGGTLNASANTITVNNLNPASVYGILQNNASLNCPNITAPGVYNQSLNYVGAPNPAPSPLVGSACVVITSSNVTFDCSGYNITNNITPAGTYGIVVFGTQKNVTVKNCPHVSAYERGVLIYESNGTNVLNTTTHNNTQYGVFVSLANNTNLSGDTAYNNTLVGLSALTGTSNSISNSIAYNNSWGFYTGLTNSLATLSNNTAYSNDKIGFYMTAGNNSSLIGNRAYNNSEGFVLSGSNNSNLLNNTAYNGTNGFYLEQSPNSTLTNNTAYDEQYGLYLTNGTTNTNIRNTTLYRNNNGFYLDAGTVLSYNMTNTSFLNPAGTYVNYTILSANDSAAAGEKYFMNWSAQPSAMPDPFHTSFEQKYVNISLIAGTPSIDSVVWTWLPSELTGYNENRFELWKYNSSGWSMLNNSPNNATHTLSLSNMNPASVYGILNATDNCPVISTPGTTYTQSVNFVGSPNNASPLTNFTCVKIAASNVVYDCNGFNITGNSSVGQTIGIEVNGSYNNITIKNCPRIANYSYGVYSNAATNVTVTNDTAFNDTRGFYINGGSGINVSGNTVLNNSQTGIESISGTGQQSYANNVVNNTPEGIRSTSSTNAVFMNNAVSNSTSYGFIIIAANNNLTGNRVGGSGYAYDVSSSSGIILTNNAANNSNFCFALYASTASSFNNNTAGNCTSEAFDVENSNLSSFTGNNATGPGSNGFRLSNVNQTNLTGNRVTSYSVYCISLLSSRNNRIVTENVSGCTQGIHLDSSSDSNLIDSNTVISNPVHGITVVSSQMNNITNNNVSSSSNYGIYLVVATNNRIVGNNVTSNNQGIRLETSSDSNLVDLNTVRSNLNFGILVLNSQQNNVTRNNASFNNYGIYVSASSNRVLGNNASSNAQTGIYVTGAGSNYNLIADNLAYNNTNFGIHVSSGGNNYNNLTNNTANLNGYGIRVEASQYCILRNNSASNNTNYGFYIGTAAHNSLLDNNTAINNSNSGFYITTSDSCNLTNNNARLSPYGIYQSGGTSERLVGNTVWNTSTNSIYVTGSTALTAANNSVSNNTGTDALYVVLSASPAVTNNAAFNNSGNGISVDTSTGALINLNTARNNGLSGIRTEQTNSSLITGNTAYLNARSGVNVRNSTLNNVTGNTAYNNTQMGIYLLASNFARVTSNRAYNNTMIGFFLNKSSNDVLSSNDAPGNLLMGYGMNESSFNSLDNCNASYSLYGFALVNSTGNNITNSFAHQFTDLNDGGGNPDITTGGRAVYLVNSSNTNLVEGNTLYDASLFGVNADHSNGTVVRDNQIYGIVSSEGMMGVGIGLGDTDTATLETNNVHDNDAGAIFDTTMRNVLTGNNLTDNSFVGVYMEETGYSNFSANRISGSMMGMMHEVSGITRMQDDHFYNNSFGDLLVNMTVAIPNIPINLSTVVFDSPGGNFENYTVLSLDDTLGLESYMIKWTNNASSLPLPPNTFSFAQKFITINDTSGGNASIDSLTFHWLQSEIVSPYDEYQFQLWKHNTTWTNTGAALNPGANTLTLNGVGSFGDFAILQNIPVNHDEPQHPSGEEDYGVKIIPACQGFIVEVKDGGSPVPNAFVRIMDQSTDTEMSPRYTNSSGQAYVSDCDIEVSVTATKSGRSGSESGMAECGFCPQCATDDDCSPTASCIDQLCIPIDCPDGMVVDHACERFECVKDSDCRANQSCISHHCITVYQCDYGLANTSADDNADCKDNEYCDVPVGQPGGSCKPITGCGEIKNHTITRWECGDAEGCPTCAQGGLCISHECVQNDLICPPSGIVGDNKTCQAKENGQPCISCDYEVTMPDGKKLTGKTDQAGNLDLPLKLAGTYKVTLFKDGVAVKAISVKALPKSIPGGEKPPAATGVDPLVAGLFLLILLAFAFGAFLYWRRRKGQSQKKYGKK